MALQPHDCRCPCAVGLGEGKGFRGQQVRAEGCPALIAGCFEEYGELSKLWSLFGFPKLGPVLGPVL